MPGRARRPPARRRCSNDWAQIAMVFWVIGRACGDLNPKPLHCGRTVGWVPASSGAAACCPRWRSVATYADVQRSPAGRLPCQRREVGWPEAACCMSLVMGVMKRLEKRRKPHPGPKPIGKKNGRHNRLTLQARTKLKPLAGRAIAEFGLLLKPAPVPGRGPSSPFSLLVPQRPNRDAVHAPARQRIHLGRRMLTFTRAAPHAGGCAGLRN